MFDYRPKLNIDALLFSLNEVLVDVSHSYHRVVQETVQLYLERAVGLPPMSPPLITLEEVNCLRRVASIDDYWNLSRAFIAYFVSLLPKVPIVTFPIRFHVPAILAYLQTASAHLDTNDYASLDQKNIPQLAQWVAEVGGGLDGLYQILPDRNRHLVVSTGKVTGINLIGRVFQEIYLGANLFEQIYQEPTVVSQSLGYIEHEKLLIKPELLDQLRSKVRLGIVSTRPEIEVKHSLKMHGLQEYFQLVISRDNLEQAQANSFPDPWLLAQAAQQLHPAHQFAYIGTTLSETQAVQAANKSVPFTSVACLAGAHDSKLMQQMFENSKTNVILGHPDNLKELILD